MSCTAHLPVNRGFTSSFGYLSGAEDHFTDTRSGFVDLWRGSAPALGENGTVGDLDYNTFKFTREALNILAAHPAASPLFIYLAYQNVHGPTQAPLNYTALYDPEKVSYEPRLLCLAMIAAVDESIGRITAALHAKGAAFWANTLIVFSSDNGGPADHANNWPLRGSKGMDFEGGTRVCAFLNGGYLTPSMRGTKIRGMMHITDWWATLSVLTGQSVADPKAAAAGGLPPPDSIDMWPMLTGKNSTSPRHTLVLRAGSISHKAAAGGGAGMIKTMTLPGAASPSRMKLVTGDQGGYWGGQYAPNNTAAVKLKDCADGCLFNLNLDPTEHDDLAADPRYAATLKLLQAELTAAAGTTFQSPGSEASDHNADLWAKAHAGFWGPWLAGPYVPPPPAPPAPPLPPTPPSGGFILTRPADSAAANGAAKCLTVLGLYKASKAVYGACDGGSHWTIDPEGASGGLVNVNANSQAAGFLRESPQANCSAGNSAQLGIAGGKGEIVTTFDEATGLLHEVACGSGSAGFCLGVEAKGSAIVLMSCDAPAAKGWKKETTGHRADPFELFS